MSLNVQGMDYLQCVGIVHRDLAARNVLGKKDNNLDIYYVNIDYILT